MKNKIKIQMEWFAQIICLERNIGQKDIEIRIGSEYIIVMRFLLRFWIYTQTHTPGLFTTLLKVFFHFFLPLEIASKYHIGINVAYFIFFLFFGEFFSDAFRSSQNVQSLFQHRTLLLIEKFVSITKIR